MTLSQQIQQLADDAQSVAAIIDNLERERDYYKRMAAKWAEVVDRQRCSYAEQVQLDEFARSLPV